MSRVCDRIIDCFDDSDEKWCGKMAMNNTCNC